jgi:hypothetical protein
MDVAFARQRSGKHVSAATDADAKIEVAVFYAVRAEAI